MKKTALMMVLIFTLVLTACGKPATPEAANPAPSNETPSEAPKETAASDFPKQPIQIIVPLAAGSGTDAIARILAEGANKYLPNGQTFVVVNKPGGAQTVGTTEVYNAKPDGYTLGVVATAPISIQPHYGTAVYSHDSFQPIVRATSDPMLLVVGKDTPFQNYEEWIEYAKANPGHFTYGTAGTGSAPQLVMEVVDSKTGVETKAVPFNSGGEQLNAVMGGHVMGGLIYPQTALPQMAEGTIRAILNVGESKFEAIKDIPLLSEKGVDFGMDLFNGVIAPKGLPEDVLNILHDVFKKTLEDPEVIAKFEAMNINSAYAGPEEFQKIITDSYHFNAEALKLSGLIE